MEAIKNAIGISAPEKEEGKEPVSGEQGAGTAAEPYDAGNREDDPAVGGKAPPGTQEKTTPAAAEPPSESTAPAPEEKVTEPAAAESTATVPEKAPEPTTTAEDAATTPEKAPEPTTTESAAAVREKAPDHTTAESTTAVPDKAPEPTEAAEDSPLPKAVAPENTPEPSAVASEEAAAPTVDGTETKSATPATSTSQAEKDATPETQDSKATKGSKKPTIGSPEWFKSTVQRRKSKDAKASADGVKAAEPKSVLSKEPKPAKKEAEVSPSPESPSEATSRRGSKWLKGANPFRRKESKDISSTVVPITPSEEKSEPSQEAVAAQPEPTPPNETSEIPPSTSSAVSPSEAPAPLEAPPTSRAAMDDDIAPDELPPGSVPAASTTAEEPQSTAEESQPTEETTQPAEETPKPPEIVVDEDKNTAYASPEPAASTPDLRKPSRPLHGENASAIPTAGGIPLGIRATDERRKSQDIRRKSQISIEPTATPSGNADSASPSHNEASTESTSTPVNDVKEEKPADVPTRRKSVLVKLKERIKI